MRNIVEKTFDSTHKYIEWYGLSTETKPTTGIVTGSTAYEIDTKTYYMFEETNTEWYEVAVLGGE